MAFVGDVFGLNSVYEKQVENVENSNFASWPESSNLSFVYAGYFGGGYTPKSHIGRLDASVNTWSLPGDYAPAALDSFSDGVSTPQYGYFGSAGHQNDYTYFSYVYRLDFSNTTSSLPGAILTASPAVNEVGGVQTPTKAYFAGGYASGGSPSYNDKIEKFTFSNESISTLPSTLSTARGSVGSVYSESYGYFAAGFIGPPSPFTTDVIDRLGFDTDTTSTLPTTYPASVNNIPSTSSPEYGYFLNTSHLVRLNFNTESFTTISNATPVGAGGRAAMSNSNFNSYFVGGFGPDYLSLTVRLDYGSETISDIGANYPEGGFSYAGGVSGGKSLKYYDTKSYGYYFGGDKFLAPPPPQIVSTIMRMDFSTGSYSDLGNSMPAQKSNVSTVASNERSYGKWTNTQVIRFDFASESNSLFTISNTPVSSGSKANASNSNYGYWLNLSRIDYSNESVSTPITQADNFSSGKNSNISASTLTSKYAYFAGGGNQSANVHSAIHKLDFSNEVITKIDPILFSNKYAHTGITGIDYGYYGGGYSTPPPGGRNTIRKMDFSTEVVSTMPNLSVAAYNRGGLSDDYYGYISGGFGPGPTNHSRVDRIDFSNSTHTTDSNLPMARDKHSGITNSISSS